MPTPATVAVQDVDHVRRITLRRPPVNALTRAEYAALEDVFDVDVTVDRAPRVVLLRAEGRIWCAGQDLRELPSLAEAHERGAYLSQAARGVAAAARCPLPIVTVLDGPAVGAGALLVACSDILVATPEGSVAFPEVRVGLNVGRALLAGVLPDPVITHAFATGDPIDAARLHQWGMVAELVHAADASARAEVVLGDLLALSDLSRAWLRDRPRRARRAEKYLDEVVMAGW